MPVKIPDALPAASVLTNENIFVMTEKRAVEQDIRPLKIAILNLMPTKEVTETQLLRLIGNTPLQIEITLLTTASYTGTHTPEDHLSTFYGTFEQIKEEKFDGLIVTGAPVENLEYEDVKYWDELNEIMDWADQHVFSTLFICWAAQAALYYFYDIPKYQLERKRFGIFSHKVLVPNHRLCRGFDDVFWAPHSRHTEIRKEDILKKTELDLLCESEEAGVYLVASKNGHHIFCMGHAEYDADTLKLEYLRDKDRRADVKLPQHYFPEDDDQREPIVNWRGHASLLFSNWLNYFVYQETPYDLKNL